MVRVVCTTKTTTLRTFPQKDELFRMDITLLLKAYGEGDKDAFDRLFELLYGQLRQQADFQLRGSRPGSLQPTALVHEVYIRLLKQENPDWKNRQHFYHLVAVAMRHVVIDIARKNLAAKRGGGKLALDTDVDTIAVYEYATQLIELNDALTCLEKTDTAAAEVFMQRFSMA